MSALSIIIPARNEAHNLPTLLEKINQVSFQAQLPYEVIIIDDHSNDATASVVAQLSQYYPITFVQKQGEVGKATAILQGFTQVKYDLIAVLDADSEYLVEVIPAMVQRILEGSDLVLAERSNAQPQFLRNLSSRAYQTVFGKLLHDLPFDINSGLKVFKSEIAERLPLSPKPWSFDLEFILKARQAQYVISSIPVRFKPRAAHPNRPSNHKWLPVSWQMATAGLYLKFARASVIPFSQSQLATNGKGFDYKGKRFVTHNDLDPHQSALYRLNHKHIFLIIDVILLLILAAMINWHFTLIVLIAALTILYFADLLFNLFLIVRSFTKAPEISISDQTINTSGRTEWPIYSIFCPLYKEHEVIPQFVDAISKMDYPKDKLQVLLLLEADDKKTIAKAREFNLPDYFEIVVVPDSLPKTKPKACNYGLIKAKGEYVVIYDAEDVPDPMQLKKAVIAFERSGPRVICIQAKLNFYNPHQNLLTRLFTAEYSLWFDLVLTGIQSINAPIPLGGTSNHFRVQDLFKLNGWDAFNVTEDCDLGMRLVKKGYRTAILDSTTLEEANSDFPNWFWQRSRWIKGYMQSYLVHMRNLTEFQRDWSEPHGITFQLIVGGKVLSMLINPLMWSIVVAYFALRPILGGFIDSLFPAPVFYMAVTSLIFGNFLYLYYYMVGCAKRGYEDLIKYAVFIPFYWLAMSLAAYMAVYKLITAPHHWSKTKHGLHLNNKKALAQTAQKISANTTSPTIIVSPHQPGHNFKRLDLNT